RAPPPLRRPLRLVRPLDPPRRLGSSAAGRGLDPPPDQEPQPGEHAAAALRRGRAPRRPAGVVGEPGAGDRLGTGREALRPAARRRPPGRPAPAEPRNPALP